MAIAIPKLYGPSGNVLRPNSTMGFRRRSAKREGSLKNWIPERFFSEYIAAKERIDIAERAIDLVNSDPNADGVVETIVSSVIGPGLKPHPVIDQNILGITKEKAKEIHRTLKNIYSKWESEADATNRHTFGAIQYLLARNLFVYGEFLVLFPMIQAPNREYMLSCQIIDPLRLKTPSDMMRKENIIDGIEIGKYGEPVAYWIKKQNNERKNSDASSNFLRIPSFKGHRCNVVHGFIQKQPEQYRGISFFSTAMKLYRDLNDFLDAELVSNIVTAAYALFIETDSSVDPLLIAQNMSSITETAYKSDGSEYDERYQELVPGQIMYGASGDKPHTIASNRPGNTFDPFTKVIKKAISMGQNVPYPVLFKDFEGMNYASYRSAMLEAWKYYKKLRSDFSSMFCQKPYQMLIEEAYLKNEIDLPNFYENVKNYTNAVWVGPPKGQIEPVKEIQADILEIKNNLKTHEQAVIERGGDFDSIIEKREEEMVAIDEKGLNYEKEKAANDAKNNS